MVPIFCYVKARNPVVRATIVKRLARQLFPEQHVERQDVFKEGKQRRSATTLVEKQHC